MIHEAIGDVASTGENRILTALPSSDRQELFGLGIVGVPLVPLSGLAVRAISQVAGHSLRIDATAFLSLWQRSSAFQALVDKYTQALFGQISQAAACAPTAPERPQPSAPGYR